MPKESSGKSSYNFFDKPLRVKLGGDSSLLLKIDAFFCGKGLCAIGGWASEPVEISLEADAKAIPALESKAHLRKDVNIVLQKKDDLERAFGFAGKLPDAFENLAIVCANPQMNFRFKLPLPLDKASDSPPPGLQGVLGEEVFTKFNRAFSRADREGMARRGRLDQTIRLASPHYGNCVIIYGWAELSGNSRLFVRHGDFKIPLDPYFWPRADIEKGKGPLANAEQLGHGMLAAFAGLPETAEDIELWEENGERKTLIAKGDVEDVFSFGGFMDEVFSLPIPWTVLAPCYEKVLLPLLRQINLRRQALIAKRPLVAEKTAGVAPRPKISLVIPLYGNLKLLPDQLMSFSEDPCFGKDAEIIYVLDDCSLLDDFKARAGDLSDLFNIPFRWVFNGSNNGFSGANNLGASIARGKYLVFMNSDVFPEKPGWLEKLCGHLENNPQTGIAGCRLLYPSGSIQHDGMDFKYKRCLKIWTNCHPRQGCDPAIISSGNADVPAVTGACLAIGRGFFEKIGGWSEDYLVGDFEDSDLCLKAREHGKSVRCLSDVKLFHLERSTFRLLGQEAMRQRTTIFNAVAHQIKWKKQLGQNRSAKGVA